MHNDNFVHIDRESYEDIWEKLINNQICYYQKRYSDISTSLNSKEEIWQEYVHFNLHCKKYYMQDCYGLLDRHKVCACYMYAIVKAEPLKSFLFDKKTNGKYFSLNEHLAITVGMSLLRAFVFSSIETNSQMPEQEKQGLYRKIDKGILFPECNHGNYRDNFVAELHFANEEKNYNILSLANTLFLLEIHTLQTEVVHRQGSRNEEN